MTDLLTWKHRPSVVDMETPANVLITGGSRGIGFALGRRYLAQGARVLVTGRSAPDLERAAAAAPGLETTVSDLGAPADREALARLVSAAMPGLDLLVHNAGIQRRIALAADTSPWTDRASEIGINLAGPVHLSHLLIPVMLAHRRPATVVTVTSGGAFVPQPFAPLYSARRRPCTATRSTSASPSRPRRSRSSRSSHRPWPPGCRGWRTPTGLRSTSSRTRWSPGSRQAAGSSATARPRSLRSRHDFRPRTTRSRRQAPGSRWRRTPVRPDAVGAAIVLRFRGR